MSNRPGLAKVRQPPLVRTRRRDLVAVTDALLRDLLERADVVSEGGDQGGSYYGTTSLILRVSRLESSQLDAPSLLAALAVCPHLKLRALRVALREALARSRSELGTMRMEMHVDCRPTELVVTVDVEATHELALVALRT
jgi:hypothetical protein